ncbi:MAG: NgoFVII family restriction endonuclease [Candidatus Liptonbacteria bacterium]|nr:NgoFVII family restriction endonuclease [Candidatus Liptonbacteria bacterium]
MTGKVTPRPWYEVELIAPREINILPVYPRGPFLAYTDDGYIIPMRTSGDNFKNIRSSGNLQLLGQWLKGKLQKSGALVPLTPATAETLEKYGNDTIRFYKVREGE